MTRYTLTPKLPGRALVVAAVLAVLGVLGLVGSLAWGWSAVFAVLGIIGLLIGLGLVIACVASLRTLAVNVDLDEIGYRISGAGEDRRGTWDEVTKVATTPDGGRLVIAKGLVTRHHVLSPGGGTDPQMVALIAGIKSHLESRA